MLLAWQLIYPILIYNILTIACVLILGERDPLLIQAVAAAAAAALLWPFYRSRRKREACRSDGPEACRSDEPGGCPESGRRDKKGISALRFMLAGAAFSVFLNNLFVITGLDRLLTGYEEVSEIIYSSPIPAQFLAVGVVIPVVEELIFRGMGYAALRTRFSTAVSMFVSAALFGAFHENLPQLIYAFAAGLILAWCYEREGSLRASILAHCSANAASVALQFLGTEGMLAGVPLIPATVLAGACLWFAMRGGAGQRTAS